MDSHCGILNWALFIKRNLKMHIFVIRKNGLGERASFLMNRKIVFGNKRPLLHSDGKQILRFQVDLG